MVPKKGGCGCATSNKRHKELGYLGVVSDTTHSSWAGSITPQVNNSPSDKWIISGQLYSHSHWLASLHSDLRTTESFQASPAIQAASEPSGRSCCLGWWRATFHQQNPVVLFRSSGGGFQWGYRNFYYSLFYNPKLKENGFDPEHLCCTALEAHCMYLLTGIWGTSIKTVLPIAGTGAGSSEESGTC